ncbi:thiamine pyrophosphate-dependent enzyme [uncultured Gemella sp.]|uniref:thiamine pyrophosphate-dependent enzyme n=1 Tax=uncultured Gemella sp. TaxID=254352 RepID=UPI0028D56469|nr:thiamine pyrophosphate-dependent enzyme [uncultured Gemella sp.]
MLRLVHIDDTIDVIDRDYQPDIELIGDISATLKCIYDGNPKVRISEENLSYLKELQKEIVKRDEPPKSKIKDRLHPLEIIQQTQNTVSDGTIVTCDIGSHGIWLARHFRSYEPHHLLFSNGMQTLGVALPWAIAAGLLYPNKKTLSISGDGSFLFSAMELETAVRLKSPIVHVVWNDSSYNMVEFQ